MTKSEDSLDKLGQRIEQATGVPLSATSRQERIDITKIALKEAIKEWMDERIKEVGRWSLRGIALATFGALIYFVLTHTGWNRP